MRSIHVYMYILLFFFYMIWPFRGLDRYILRIIENIILYLSIFFRHTFLIFLNIIILHHGIILFLFATHMHYTYIKSTHGKP